MKRDIRESRNAIGWAQSLRRTVSWMSLTVGLSLGMSHPYLMAQAQSAPPLVQSGYSYLDRGWVDRAIATFEQAVAQYPQSVAARLGLAIAYQRNGQDADAWDSYQQVLVQEPQNRTALAAVGSLGGYRTEWQRSGIAALTTLLDLSPEDQAARAQRAQLYRFQGNFAAALSDYQLLLDNPTPEVLLGAAQAYTYSGNPTEGLALFDRYRATGAALPNAVLAAYGLSLQQTGQSAQAIEILSSRLSGLSGNEAIEVRSVLAQAYQANQQTDLALETLAPLRSDPAARLPLARSLSGIARSAGDMALYQQAIELYQQVLADTATPSLGLLTEAADVFSEVRSTQPEALQLYRQIAAAQPDVSIELKQSILEAQLGQLSRSELTARIAELTQPLSADAVSQTAIAQALVRLDPPEPALLSLYETLNRSANLPFLQFRIAQIQTQQNDLAAARQSLAVYAQTSSGATDPARELLLAEIDRREGNLSASADRYQAILAQTRSANVRRSATQGLAGVRLAQGDPAAALALYDRLVAEQPNDLASRLGRTAIAYQLQQVSLSEASQILSQAEADPTLGYPPELFALAGALPAAPQREALYETLLAIDPDNIPVTQRWVQLWALRDPDRATARVDRLIQRYPNNPAVYFVQGELGQTLGDLDLASQAYETILATQPDNGDALAALGGVRFQQRRYAEADRLFRQALALNPNSLETRRVLAELSLVQDLPLTALQQLQAIQRSQPQTLADRPAESAAPDSIDRRIEDVRVDFLERRGFQPDWERY